VRRFPRERASYVGLFGNEQQVRRVWIPGRMEPELYLVHQRCNVCRVLCLELWKLPARLQLLMGILIKGLEHRVACRAVRLLDAKQEAVQYQRCHAIDDVYPRSAAQCLRRFKRATTDEDSEATEDDLLLGCEQVMAPSYGVA
jgi:hypothetical protein